MTNTDPLAPSPAAASPEKRADEHDAHGRVTAEDYPNMSHCPCCGGPRQAECAAAGCGYCTIDGLEPYRTKASPEQRAACLHPPDDRVPLSGDGWLCGLCGADCAPPEQAPAELTAERLDELDRRARETFARHSFAQEPEKALSAAVLALSAEVRRLREALLDEWVERKEAEAARGEAMAMLKSAGIAGRLRDAVDRNASAIDAALAEPAADDLAAIEAAAREDKVVARRATPRPWKWWTANSVRELRSEAGRRSATVACGQQHPHDRVIDIAIQEPDMALIERAVNGIEERADALLRLTREVRRRRKREEFVAMCLRAGPLPTSALASGEPPRAGEEQGDG